MKRWTPVLLVVLCLLFPGVLAAQKSGFTHSYSLTHDEDGNRFTSPIFVLAEQVMDEIYVISMSRVQIFTRDFYHLYSFGKERGIETPLSLAVDAEGYVYVVQSPTEKKPQYRISVYNPSFLWEYDIHVEGFAGDDSFVPNRLAVDGERRIYVAGTSFRGVPVLDREGRFIELMQPVEEEHAVQITDVAVGEDGKIYLLSGETSQVYVYDEDREVLFKFGKKGGTTGKLSRPVGVDVDSRGGRVLVVDYMRHTVLVYDQEGKYLSEFGGLGWGAGWFQYPSDVAVDSSGRAMVADTFNNRVEIFKPVEEER